MLYNLFTETIYVEYSFESTLISVKFAQAFQNCWYGYISVTTMELNKLNT